RRSTGRPAIVAFSGACHGRTYGGLSLTASKSLQRAGFAPFLPEVYHVPYGYRYRCDFCRGEAACTMRCVSSIEDDLFAKRLDPKSTAAIFVEPIQGEGGYVVPPPGYVKALRELCDRYGILVACDEVQCGVGRTGQKRLQQKYRSIGDVRGRGLMIGVEFVKDRATRDPAPEVPHELVTRAFRKGLLLLGAGKSALRLAPPLVVDEADVDTALGIIDECLGEMTD